MNNTIQYFHDKQNGYTYAVDVFFTSEVLLRDVTNLRIGISKKHPEDRYNKKIGRQVSSARLQFQNFSKEICQNAIGDNIIYFLSDNLELTFTVSKKSNKPYFINARKY